MLCRRWQREVIIRAPDAGRGGNAFLPEGRAVAACVQPLRGALAQQMYGQEPEQMRLMLCGLCADLSAGDGVCVDVPPDADPDTVEAGAPIDGELPAEVDGMPQTATPEPPEPESMPMPPPESATPANGATPAAGQP